jgi:hypothetical protein
MSTQRTPNPTPRDPSSFDFQQLAEGALDAANTCFFDWRRRDDEFAGGNREDQGTFMVIPTVFLYFRAIELSLKAAIRENGLATLNEIRSRTLGHNLTALLQRATTVAGAYTCAELGVDRDAQDFIGEWSDDYATKWFEYHFGPWDIPNPQRCQEVATAIVEAIRSIATSIELPEVS